MGRQRPALDAARSLRFSLIRKLALFVHSGEACPVLDTGAGIRGSLLMQGYCNSMRNEVRLYENGHFKLFIWIPDQVGNDKPGIIDSSKA